MADKGLTKAQIAARKAKSAALSAKYKHEASVLKSKGVLSSKVDARKKITRATRTKINKFRDVLEGKSIAVRAKPDVRAKYDGVLPSRGSFLIVDAERKREKAKIARGMVEITRPISAPDKLDVETGKRTPGLVVGEEREVILPFKLIDMHKVAERLQTDESLDGLKQGDEMFAFKLDGWASKIGFADAKEMGDYITRNYAHLFKPNMAKQVVKYLTFVRYKASGEVRAKEGKHSGNLRNKPFHKQRDNKYDRERTRERARNRKANQRENESDSKRAKRLEDQRKRSARNRQKRFEES